MRKLLFALVLTFNAICMAQNSSDYTIQEKFVFHQIDVLDTKTDEVLQSFPDGSGLIIRANIQKTNYMIISIGDFHRYSLTIVNKVEDFPRKDVKIIMYQGGGKLDVGTYTANIFFIYDLSKNKNTPEFVRLEINGSSNIMKYSGIIKLDK